MKIVVRGNHMELTSALRMYIEKRMEHVAKFVKRYEEKGETTLFVEIALSTKHHKHGNVFLASAKIQLPGKVIKAEHFDSNGHRAVDTLEEMMKRDLKKYKDKSIAKIGERRDKRSSV